MSRALRECLVSLANPSRSKPLLATLYVIDFAKRTCVAPLASCLCSRSASRSASRSSSRSIAPSRVVYADAYVRAFKHARVFISSVVSFSLLSLLSTFFSPLYVRTYPLRTADLCVIRGTWVSSSIKCFAHGILPLSLSLSLPTHSACCDLPFDHIFSPHCVGCSWSSLYMVIEFPGECQNSHMYIICIYIYIYLFFKRINCPK